MFIKWSAIALLACGLALPAGGAWADKVPGAKDALNSVRKQAKVKKVKHSKTLQKVAENHARDMSDNGFFSHTGSNGSSVGKRAKRQKYKYCFIAENIAQGQDSLDEVMAAWMRSEGHRKNMLHKKVREFGLARVGDDYWVMVLAKPGCR